MLSLSLSLLLSGRTWAQSGSACESLHVGLLLRCEASGCRIYLYVDGRHVMSTCQPFPTGVCVRFDGDCSSSCVPRLNTELMNAAASRRACSKQMHGRIGMLFRSWCDLRVAPRGSLKRPASRSPPAFPSPRDPGAEIVGSDYWNIEADCVVRYLRAAVGCR